MATNNTTLADFIWKNADDLWGHFKHVEFGKIILPFTLLRRLECVQFLAAHQPSRSAFFSTTVALNLVGFGCNAPIALKTTCRKTAQSTMTREPRRNGKNTL